MGIFRREEEKNHVSRKVARVLRDCYLPSTCTSDHATDFNLYVYRMLY